MWGVTQHYLDTLVRPHVNLAKIDILQDGALLATISGVYHDPATGDTLSAIDGAINVDKTVVRRSGTITFLNPGGQLIPQSVSDLLAPYVTELRIWTGVRYWDAPFGVGYASQVAGQLVAGVPVADSEFVPVGTLVITDLDTANFPQITCQLYDRAWLLAPFVSPYSITAGADPGAAINGILANQLPPARLVSNVSGVTDLTVPAQTFDANTSSGDACASIANSVGWVFYVDPMGVFQTDPQPSTADPAVLSLAPAPTTAITRPRKHIGEQVGQMYNAVVFTGEGGSTAPVRGYAEDDDPTSPTYVGRVGIRPYFESSPLMTTNAQCNAAALTRLRAILGINNQLVVPILPNHALESGDVVAVSDPAQGINENAIVDAFAVNLRAGTSGLQDLTCRVRVSN